MIKEKEICIKWNASTKKRYQSLGYIFTKIGDEFSVLTEHLPQKSAVRVTAICVKCYSERAISRYAYRELCQRCASGYGNKSRPNKNRIYEVCSDRNILGDTVKVKWNTTTKFHFESFGYLFTKFGQEFDAKVVHLPKNSNVEVIALCELCNVNRKIKYCLYNSKCKPCALKSCNNDENFKARRVAAIKEMHLDVEKREKWMKTHSKEGHPFWNPSKTDEERTVKRKTLENKVWSLEVKKIGHYKCIVCNYKGNKLASHHLMGYDKHPELRYDVTNGVCLCSDCHKDFHTKYGYGNNTKQQFEEYSLFALLHKIISIDSYIKEEK